MSNAEDKEEVSSTEKDSQAEIAAEISSVDLPAPNGWKKKKFTPKKGVTPRRNEIVFISPTGEEIRSKRQLEKYIKSHPGGPSSAEFDWGTGDTPRRSSRISEKVKATETPEGEPSKKREKKSSLAKAAEEKKENADGEVEEEDDAAGEESKTGPDTEMKEADGMDKVDEQVATKEAAMNEDTVEQVEKDEVNPEEGIGSDAKEVEEKNRSPPVLPSQTEEDEKVEKEQPVESVVHNAEAMEENKVGEGFPANGCHKDDQDGPKETEVHSTVNYADGQLPSKTSPVNC